MSIWTQRTKGHWTCAYCSSRSNGLAVCLSVCWWVMRLYKHFVGKCCKTKLLHSLRQTHKKETATRIMCNSRSKHDHTVIITQQTRQHIQWKYKQNYTLALIPTQWQGHCKPNDMQYMYFGIHIQCSHTQPHMVTSCNAYNSKQSLVRLCFIVLFVEVFCLRDYKG